MQAKALADRITNYLGNGGYFNPEMMEHEKVRNLLIDCREYFNAQAVTNIMKNPNCDNDKCLQSAGEVRLLPLGSGANLILCKACFEHEIRYRRERNRSLGRENQFQTPTWEMLSKYETTN